MSAGDVRRDLLSEIEMWKAATKREARRADEALRMHGEYTRQANARLAEVEAERDRLRAEALPIAFADCEALVVAMARQLGEDLESGTVVVPGDHPNGGLIASWAVNSLALAINMGQHRTAETNERAVVAAHREAAGFNSSRAGGEARSRALSPAKRKKIATKAARVRWAAKKGE